MRYELTIFHGTSVFRARQYADGAALTMLLDAMEALKKKATKVVLHDPVDKETITMTAEFG